MARTKTAGAVRLAFVLAVMATAGTSPAFAKKKKPPPVASSNLKVSPAFRQAMAEAQAAVGVTTPAQLRQRLNAAASVAQTADEKYYVGALRYKQAEPINDRAEMRKAANEMLQSGSTLMRNQAELALLSGGLAFELNDPYDAVTRMAQADRLGSTDVSRFLVSAEAYARLRQPADALAMFEKTMVQPGIKAQESWYFRAMSLAIAAKQPDAAARWGAELVRAFPTPDNVRTAAFTYRDGAKLAGPALLDLARLVADAKALAGERDHLEFATLALANNAGGAAKAVIEAGYASGFVPRLSAAAKASLAKASPKALSERGAAVAAERSASSATDGKAALNAANGYLSVGDSLKAAALYSLALKKGGIDADLANLRRGIAQARLGQKAEAAQSFAAVAGETRPVAQLWAAFVG